MELKNTSCLISGASGSLGYHLALEVARGGCDCICQYYSNAQKAGRLVKEIEGFGRKALAVKADLRSQSDIRKIFEAAGEFTALRLLINSAAVFDSRKLNEVDPCYIRETFEINTSAPLLMSKYFIEYLRQEGAINNEQVNTEAGQGVIAKIVNIADVGGMRPWSDYSVYCASKAAVISITQSLAKELAPQVCVNAVSPGVVDGGEEKKVEHEQWRLRQLAMIPEGRFARPGEVSAAVMFLIENDYLTGQVINVDGGRCI